MAKTNKAKINRSYASVSFDGRTPVSSNTDSEKELYKKKLDKQVNTANKVASEDNKTKKVRVIDKRNEETEEMIRKFLRLSKETELTRDFLLAHFLELIVNYMNLFEINKKNENTLKRIKAGSVMSLQDAAPCW